MASRLSGLILLLSLIVAGIKAQNVVINTALPQSKNSNPPFQTQAQPALPSLHRPDSGESAALAALYPQVFDLRGFVRDLRRQIEILEIERGLLLRGDHISLTVKQGMSSLEAQVDANARALENFKEELSRKEKELAKHLKTILSASRMQFKARYDLILSALDEKMADMRRQMDALARETSALRHRRLKLGPVTISHSSKVDGNVILLDTQIRANIAALRGFQKDLEDAEKARHQFLKPAVPAKQ